MKLIKSIATCAALAMSVSAPASFISDGIDKGYVTGFNTTGGRFLIYMSGTRVGRPACDCCNRFEIAGSDQTNIAVLLTAYSLHHTVTLSGTGSCGSSDTEGVAFLGTDGAGE